MNLSTLISHINAYESGYSSWHSRAEKIEKRYEDERPANSKAARFNILWSNVQTLAPALYDRQPTPNIERRNRDEDDLGREVSEILERSASYFVKTEPFNEVMVQVVLDRLLGGRGVAWVRYVPNFKDIALEGSAEVKQEGVQVTNNVTTGDDAETKELYSEDVVTDYVNCGDFGHNIARTWQEVWLVWRKAYLDRKELIERFPNKGEHIPLDAKPMGTKDNKDDAGKKATIYEMWDKKNKRVYWIHKEFSEVLDVKDDPLRLKGFFPCPKPLYATLTNKTLIPTPDYVQYQDQANELDSITGRISLLIKALRVAGVYDASAEGIQKLLNDPSGSNDNKLYPVDQWAMFAQNGGLKGAVDFLPIEQIAAVLTGLYAARDKIKQDIYEITGISDIIRGTSNPNETLGAQELKGKYAGLRLGAMQRDVARFARDLVEMTTEIIAEHFDLETIKQISGVKLLTIPQKQEIQILMQQYQQLAAQAQQIGQQPPAPPIDEKTADLMKLPSWEDVEQMIRQDMPRCFIIDIETDSTIKADQDAEKAARTEFLTATGSFLQQAAQIQDPALKPVLMEMLMFGVRGFKEGRQMEAVFENAIDKMKKADEQQQSATQDPQAQVLEKEIAVKEKELALKDKEITQKGALLDKEFAIKDKELGVKDKEIEADFAKHKLTTDADIAKTRIDAKTKVSDDVALMDDDLNDGQPSQMVQMIVGALQAQSESMAQGLMQIAQMNADSNRAVIEAITKPKITTVIRDPKTKELIGSEQRVE